MKIKAVLFDMDGVLIEAKEWHYESLNQALRILGVIGNSGKYSRFSFKGEADIDPCAPLIVHYPLRRYFKI